MPASFYASPELLKLVSKELSTAGGGFTGAVQQLANVATLPGTYSFVFSNAVGQILHATLMPVSACRYCGVLHWHARHP